MRDGGGGLTIWVDLAHAHFNAFKCIIQLGAERLEMHIKKIGWDYLYFFSHNISCHLVKKNAATKAMVCKLLSKLKNAELSPCESQLEMP